MVLAPGCRPYSLPSYVAADTGPGAYPSALMPVVAQRREGAGLGDLLDVGVVQHQHVGQRLRRRLLQHLLDQCRAGHRLVVDLGDPDRGAALVAAGRRCWVWPGSSV